jgi:thiol-disulfide isomerase/thioredoxin
MLLESVLRALIGLIPVLLVSLGACDRQSNPAPQPKAEKAAPATSKAAATEEVIEIMGPVDRTHKGKPAPNDPFTAPNGDTVRISDFKGQPVLLNLWATWCGPCIAEMPALDALATREVGNILVLAVSQDMKGKEAVDRWWKEQTIKTLQPYLDTEANLSFALGGGSLPTTIYYDREGKEVWRITGASQWDGEAARELLDEVG